MPFDDLFAHQIGDVLEQPLLVDLIRNLGDDDRELVALLAIPRSSACARRVMAPRPVVYAWKMPLAPDDVAAGREVGAGDRLAAPP